ncbi:MAG: TolC family protein [Bacteroidota bacterium]
MKITFTIMFLCFLAFNAAVAQDSKILTLESAVQLALEKNQTLVLAKNSVDLAQSGALSSFGNFLPNLSFIGGFSRQLTWKNSAGGVTYINNVPIPTAGGTTNDAFNTVSTGLQSRMTLFNGFVTNYNYKSAQAIEDAAAFGYTRQQQATIYGTHQLFLTVVKNYEIMKVSEDNLIQARGQLERIKESNKVGAVAIADVYRQQTIVGQDEFTLIQAQNNFEKAKADVLAYLGVPLDTAYQFDFSGIPTDIDTTEFPALNAQYKDFKSLVAQAIEKRPDHLSNIASFNSSEAAASSAKAAYFPTVSASANYGLNNDAFNTLKDNRSLSVGLNVSLPIFNGFQTQTGIQTAQVQQQNAELKVQQSQLTVTVDLRKALLDLEAFEREVISTQTSVVSSTMDKKIAEEKYSLGSGTILDLQLATANYTTAMSNKVNAVNDFLLAKKNLELAMGTLAR